MTRALVLRFDIDTYRCIKHGVPNLLKMASEEQVQFTFFCNMGRAISRFHVLNRLLRHRQSRSTAAAAAKLPVSVKQGYYQLLRTLLINPRVGLSHPEILRRAHEEGHDIGLHGGRNHGAWQHGFRDWGRERVQREVSTGKAMFERALGHSPLIFSSPGWQGSRELNAILKSTGFSASADRHGPGENEVIYENDFYTLPTNLVAEPGGVAYFESFAARGCSDGETVDRFRETLTDGRSLYVLYDHPCYAGVDGIETVRQTVRCAIENGLEIVTFASLIRRAKNLQ